MVVVEVGVVVTLDAAMGVATRDDVVVVVGVVTFVLLAPTDGGGTLEYCPTVK